MKKALFAVITFSFIAASAGSAFATWDTCDVDRVGVAGDSSTVFKVAACGTAGNDGKWLQLQYQTDRSLATLLTALSLATPVKINADFAAATTNGSAYGAVDALYLNQPE